MKPFRIVSAEADAQSDAVKAYAQGDGVKVTIRFDRTLSTLEAKRVISEAHGFVGDSARVGLIGSKLMITTRDFGAVREFIEAANSYSAEWTGDVAQAEADAKSTLDKVNASLKPLVKYETNESRLSL